MNVRYALLVATLALPACEKKPDAAPAPATTTAAATRCGRCRPGAQQPLLAPPLLPRLARSLRPTRPVPSR